MNTSRAVAARAFADAESVSKRAEAFLKTDSDDAAIRRAAEIARARGQHELANEILKLRFDD